jgi:hypothetical protein
VIHSEWLTVGIQPLGIATIESRVEQAMVDREEIERNLCKAWERKGRVLKAPITVDELSPSRANLRSPIEEADHRAQGISEHARVGIQE